MTLEEITRLVAANNQSTLFSNEFVTCLIWKESTFDPTQVSGSSTATGLMQMTKAAVTMVNSNSPKGVHFTHADMTDAAKCIQCGTRYLDICKTKMGGIDTPYGTGPGYSKNIIACETCMKDDSQHPQAALFKIHP